MTHSCEIAFNRPSADTLLLRLSGAWNIESQLPDIAMVEKEAEAAPKVDSLSFATEDVTAWDTSLLAFLTNLRDLCARNSIRFDPTGLPEGVGRLMALAAAVPESKGTRRESVRESFLVRVGSETAAFGRSAVEMLAFIGEATVATLKMLRGRRGFRFSDLFSIMQACGVQALPIVSLISLLVGLILAFVGAIQLMMFGAQIYVASLVGISMVRVMGAIMAGIIMAGRTGASFAAQLGTMQVNEEIDALKTMGISPMEFLVLPRMLAMALMMPLLCLYADLMGVLGGMIVGVGMLDLNVMEYYQQTRISVSLNDFWIGLFQSSVFGILVAVSGCLRGIQCGRSASAVGEAATSAVVTGIVSIIVATALITIMCSVIGI
ncbi:ABC transporter permease [Thermodesulfobacteriota bacterium]